MEMWVEGVWQCRVRCFLLLLFPSFLLASPIPIGTLKHGSVEGNRLGEEEGGGKRKQSTKDSSSRGQASVLCCLIGQTSHEADCVYCLRLEVLKKLRVHQIKECLLAFVCII